MDFQLPGLGLLPKLLPGFLASIAPLQSPLPDLIQACLALKSSVNIENTTITGVSYVPAGSTVATPGVCVASTDVVASVCRVEFTTRTSAHSEVRAEAWLPDEWYGRFLGAGNGGLGGCIDYGTLNYGTAYHFATVGSDNGHDGSDGSFFLDKPEVINDFAFRAIHVEAVVGKQLVEAYYKRPHDKSYYLGCSTGGRQGTQAALKFPEDFDGIVAGAPAHNWNHLMYWTGITARHIGSPDFWSSSAYIPPHLWKTLIVPEILRQCDTLDGVKDGIITEPDECDFQPETLLCRRWPVHCLSQHQVDALRKIYAPVFVDGKFVYPRFDPGAEADAAALALFGGAFPDIPKSWLRYVVLNDTDFDVREFGAEHLRLMDAMDNGGISTFDGDLSAFRARGGKFLTYHGRMDPLIASGNSKNYYDLISQTLGSPDDFYRLFLIPGMGHCAGGPGSTRFGQLGRSIAPHNDTQHNILLALVDWVEHGVAPEVIIGTSEGGQPRVHCPYPAASVWDGEEFVCVD
ncbi:Carboxylic ester hydrolase [Mycena chlorophos]|uniref:Carboxylic ester hydrolase n=1 Tax=Mycena chlorophos TaxID=658473 RepID=A0A8H6SJ40_MYCCL|nr:Carboxylic ester hydrolase [Mycena chlorophos]